MERPPSISVILPVRNAAGTILRAIDSIRRQSWTDWELVVVDDGSTDGTTELVARIAHDEPRLRHLRRAPAGLVGALNAGLAESRGEWIARLDADDESHPDRLARQADFLAHHPSVGVVACLVAFGGDRVAQAGYARYVDWINGLVEPAEIALNRFVESPLAHPSVLFRRDCVRLAGGYREGDFPEDYELWLRWAEAGVRFAKVRETLLTWHDAPTRLSRTDSRYAPEAFFRIKAGYLARHLQAQGRDTVWLWGAGRHTRKRAAHLLAHGLRFAGYVDVDAKKVGRSVGGLPVIPPTALPPPGEAFVLGYVSSRGAREFIHADLCARGYRAGGDFLMGA